MEETQNLDRRAIACNFAEGTKIASPGARAFVSMTNPGGGSDRVAVILRSRSGRWVQKWERIDRLCNFRMTTIPPGNPHYVDDRISYHLEEATSQALNEVSRRARVARGLSADVDIEAIRRVGP